MTKQQHEEIKERGIGSEVDHFAYRISIENHDAMMELNKQFADKMRKYE